LGQTQNALATTYLEVNVARRPDPFDKESFQASLRRQGCAESFVSPITSDFRLFVPLVFRALGEERILSIVEQARAELKLGPQELAWREAAKYIVGWSEEQIETYKSQKG
jgi:hypothetical protein